MKKIIILLVLILSSCKVTMESIKTQVENGIPYQYNNTTIYYYNGQYYYPYKGGYKIITIDENHLQ